MASLQKRGVKRFRAPTGRARARNWAQGPQYFAPTPCSHAPKLPWYVTGLQMAAGPARAVATHVSAWVYVAHVPDGTWVSHCKVVAESAQPKQLSAVQSTMHALLWLQVAST